MNQTPLLPLLCRAALGALLVSIPPISLQAEETAVTENPDKPETVNVTKPTINLGGVAAAGEFDRHLMRQRQSTKRGPNLAKRLANRAAQARANSGTEPRRGLTLTSVAAPSSFDRQQFEQVAGHSRHDIIALEEATYLPSEAAAARAGRPGSEAVAPPGSWNRSIEPDSWFQQEFLTGNWWGYRPKLEKEGVTFSAAWATNLLGNPSGGRTQGFEAAASLGMTLNFDMEKLAGIKGGEFVTGAIWRVGNNLSDRHIGNLLTAAQLYGGQNMRLMYLYWQQSLLDDDLVFKVGRFAAFDDFLADSMNWNYVNNGFDGNVKGVFFQIPAFGNTVYPTSSWGAFGKYTTPDRDFYGQLGIYGISSRNGQNNTSGLNFTFDFDQGAAILGQGGWTPNGEPNDPDLPGKYSLGFFISTNEFTTFDVPRQTTQTNGGFYWMLQQMVYREPGEANMSLIPNHYGPDGQNGLYLWTQAVWTPDAQITEFNFYQNMGVLYQGPIPGRPQDFAAFGWGWLQAPEQQRNYQRATGAAPQDYEMVLEWNYRYHVTRFFYIQPDIQYIIQPDATGDIPNALVLGAQIGVVF